jgi:hypothetical protein
MRNRRMAALMEDVLFELPEYPEKSIRFDALGVKERLPAASGRPRIRSVCSASHPCQ